LAKAVVLGVTDDADDFDRLGGRSVVGASHVDHHDPADWPNAVKVPPRHRIVDHRNHGCVERVPVLDAAAIDQRHSDRFEIPRRYRVEPHGHPFVRTRRVISNP
jgi:hypothetical protein